MVGFLTTSSGPVAVDAVVLDMDGVLTDTARVHRHAWADLFNRFLAEHAAGAEWTAFSEADYLEHVDGKRREDGIVDFLAARGIRLPEEQVRGLGDEKNDAFLGALARDGVAVFPDTVAFLARLAALGVPRALITASRNAEPVLVRAALGAWFDAVVDGVVAARLALPGKPDPAVFVEAARQLGTVPARTAVVEDAVAGVRAGRAGGFALVVGLDRSDDPAHVARLRDAGADLVLTTLDALEVRAASTDPA
jgi:beta-phosphoglucomutase family hydrolase